MPSRKCAVPLDLQDRAVISGLSPAVRTWGAAPSPAFVQELLESVPRERAHRTALGQTGPLPPAEYLAISGGGQNGAFSSGLLNGWTAAGNRPQFKAVTGISTGALVAPLAFLGPEYDDALRAVYTEVSTKDILTKRNLLVAVLHDALADNRPLWGLVERHIDRKWLDAAAQENAKGRLLLIGSIMSIHWPRLGLGAASAFGRVIDPHTPVVPSSRTRPSGPSQIQHQTVSACTCDQNPPWPSP